MTKQKNPEVILTSNEIKIIISILDSILSSYNGITPQKIPQELWTAYHCVSNLKTKLDNLLSQYETSTQF